MMSDETPIFIPPAQAAKEKPSARVIVAMAETTLLGALLARDGEPLNADLIEKCIQADQDANSVGCDQCGAAFIPDVQETPTPDGGAYMRFLCPRCTHEYPVAVITPHGLRLREQMVSVQRVIDRGGDFPRWRKELQNLKKQFEREVRKGQRPTP